MRASARAVSLAPILGIRSVVSRIAVTDQSSALACAVGSLVCSRFHAARQRAEQNRACSRRGENAAPHCSQSRVSGIAAILLIPPVAWHGSGPAWHPRASIVVHVRPSVGHHLFIMASVSGRLDLLISALPAEFARDLPGWPQELANTAIARSKGAQWPRP